jgi:hypothetical protein
VRNGFTREAAAHDDDFWDKVVLHTVVEYSLKPGECLPVIQPHIRKTKEVNIREFFLYSLGEFLLRRKSGRFVNKSERLPYIL